MAEELFKGQPGSPITYLVSDISAGQSSIAIGDDSVLPNAPNICTIGFGENIETIKYTGKANGLLTGVTRGIEGDPRAWPSGAEVARFFTAYDHNNIIEAFKTHQADFASLLEGGENYQATLQNGWTAASGGIKYRKNDLGIVRVWGVVYPPSELPPNPIATLPAGFRPLRRIGFSYYDAARAIVYNGFVVHSTGELQLTKPGLDEILTSGNVGFDVLFYADN